MPSAGLTNRIVVLRLGVCNFSCVLISNLTLGRGRLFVSWLRDRYSWVEFMAQLSFERCSTEFACWARLGKARGRGGGGRVRWLWLGNGPHVAVAFCPFEICALCGQ